MKELKSTDTSLELYQDGKLEATFSRGRIKTKVTSKNVRVELLDMGFYFDLSVGDSVDGVVQTNTEDLASLVGSFSKGGTVTPNEVLWEDIQDKPTTFSPSTHTHNASDINAGVLAIARVPTGTSGTTVALGNHTHAISGVTGLQTALDGKQASLPAVPTTGTFVLTSTDGVLSWEAQA